MRNKQIKIGFSSRLTQYKPGLIFSWLMSAGLVLALSGCGDSPQAEGASNTGSGTIAYSGNPPASADIISFRIEFWEPLRASNRCGSCHNEDQDPEFVNFADVNVAYEAATDYVNVTDTANSRFVTKVGQGHNCWLGSTSASNRACADIITRYINNWLGSAAGSGRAIALTAPINPQPPGDSKNFPATATDSTANFSTTVYPLLRDNCAGCHTPTASVPQAPFFADSDVSAAYEAAKSKMDLNEVAGTPDSSRFVLRLRNEFHNCWTSGSTGCQADATEMDAAIVAFAGGINVIPINPNLLTSKSMSFQSAIIASGGARYETNMIALWEFKEGEGSTSAADTSGIEPAINLTLNGARWVSGYGLEFNGTGGAFGVNASKLYDSIIQTSEYAIEAWVVPANVTQPDSSIVTFSDGSNLNNRNFTMGQDLYNYDFINHSTTSSGSDADKLSTADADQDLQATLQHVVMNFDPINGRQILVNGVSTGDADPDLGGNITGWNNGFPLVLGSEQGGSSAWSGKIRMLAIYKRTLTAEQARQNYSVGVGQKYLLLFSLADIDADVPATSYIMFEAEQYDNYSYLFSSPKFINLDTNWTPSTAISIKGMRIGINGKEANSGQVYANMDATVTSSQYTVDGQLLSRLGTLVTVENANDEFFLTFEQIDTTQTAYDYTEADPVAASVPVGVEMLSKIGVRTFDEINATMSAVTGVAVTNTQISDKFNLYKRQLPAVEDVQAYLSSHQMAVAQLAMKYCDVLVETAPAYFTPFNFAQTPSVALATTTGRNNVLNPLLKSIMNVDMLSPAKNLGSQPAEGDIRDALSSSAKVALGEGYAADFDSLMQCMTRCAVGGVGAVKCDIYTGGVQGQSCTLAEVSAQNTAARTKQVVKASCAAMLGSAVMLIQ